MTSTDAFWMIYAGITFILLLTGLLDFFVPARASEKRSGARRALAGPVWPIALVVLVMVALVQLMIDLWKAAK